MENNKSKKVDRSKWLTKVISNHPEVKEMRNRLNPIDRSAEFGRIYKSIPFLESDTMQLILQHLKIEGLKKTFASLEKEANITQNFNSLNEESRLVTLLKLSMRETEKLWDLTIGKKNYNFLFSIN